MFKGLRSNQCDITARPRKSLIMARNTSITLNLLLLKGQLGACPESQNIPVLLDISSISRKHNRAQFDGNLLEFDVNHAVEQGQEPVLRSEKTLLSFLKTLIGF